MADILGDIGSLLGASDITPAHSTSRKKNTELNMEDFLQLMIVQLTSQTIDDTMDTSEMMNQMVQMQMITAITNMTQVNIQSYANSLVGQLVTVGIVQGNTLEERVIQVMGTGTYNGEQVIFGSDGNMYFLNQVMAVGVLPDENGKYPQLGGAGGPSEEDPDPDMGVDPDEPGDTAPPDETTGSGGATESGGAGGTENPEYDGTQGAET